MVDSRCICERLKPGQGWILWPGEGREVWLVRRKNGRDYSLEFRVSEGRLIRERAIEEERGLGYRLLRILRRPSDAATVPIRYCLRCGRPLYEEMAEVLIQRSASEQAKVLENSKKKTEARKDGGESGKPYIRAMLLVVILFNALLLLLTLLKL